MLHRSSPKFRSWPHAGLALWGSHHSSWWGAQESPETPGNVLGVLGSFGADVPMCFIPCVSTLSKDVANLYGDCPKHCPKRMALLFPICVVFWHCNAPSLLDEGSASGVSQRVLSVPPVRRLEEAGCHSDHGCCPCGHRLCVYWICFICPQRLVSNRTFTLRI